MAVAINNEDGDLGFQIAPMVDVVFVLMLFFLACAGFQQVEMGLSADMGRPYPGTIEVPINVQIAEDGSVYLQERLMAAPGDHAVAKIEEWLVAARENFGTSDPLVISPAPAARHERVMEVFSAVKAAKWDKVSFR